MKDIVIGIDQSLTGTGFAVIEEGDLSLIEYGTLKSAFKGAERLHELGTDLEELIQSYVKNKRYRVKSVAVEDYAYNKKFSSGKVFDLAELGGVFKRVIHASGVPLEIISTTEHVKHLLGKLPQKRSDKLPRIHEVNRLYDLTLRTGKSVQGQDSDIADAISIARFVAMVVNKRA